MKKLSKNAIIGYPAGIITGITYGLNPLFAVPLMKNGAATESILFFRYAFAVLLLGLFLLLRKQSFRVSGKQIGVLFVLGLLYTSSSIFLFDAYEYIASGLATTLVFLYPVLVAIIMVFLKVVPSWPVWMVWKLRGRFGRREVPFPSLPSQHMHTTATVRKRSMSGAMIILPNH